MHQNSKKKNSYKSTYRISDESQLMFELLTTVANVVYEDCVFESFEQSFTLESMYSYAHSAAQSIGDSSEFDIMGLVCSTFSEKKNAQNQNTYLPDSTIKTIIYFGMQYVFGFCQYTNPKPVKRPNSRLSFNMLRVSLQSSSAQAHPFSLKS